MIIRTAMLASACAVLALPRVAHAQDLLIDDFSTTLAGWTHKNNAVLSLDHGALKVRADFSRQRYIWFRKAYHEKPLDLRPYEGLQFRIKGAAGCKLLVHLISDVSSRPPRTFVIARPFHLVGDAWRTLHVAWFEMSLQNSGTPITSGDLAHVQEVNFSLVSRDSGSTTAWLDDVRPVMLPAAVKQAVLERLRFRRPVEDEAAFFAMLDYERFPALKPVRDALPDYVRAKAALLRYMRTRTTPRYTFDPHDTDALAAAMRKLAPKWPPAVIRSADRMLTHVYTWEGETRRLPRPLDYRQKGRQWSAVLNRFGFLTNVARAWWFTHDEKYAEEVVGQMCEWARSCPVPLYGPAGRTWLPLEVGVRAHTWLRLYLSVLHSKSLTPEANYTILKSLVEQADFLSDPDLRMGLPNMIIIESTGLAGLAIMFPEFRDSARRLERGLAVLDAELSKRVLGDGAWEEVTPGYHCAVARSCLGFSILARRNDVAPPGGFEQRFRSMYKWLLKITKPDGHMPMLGDASDGHVGLLMTEAALFFRDPGFRYFARDALSPGLLEWFGADAPARYATIPKREPRFRSMLLPDCCLAVMRTGYQRDDSCLLFDFGPIWSHTHQDTLGIILYAAGQTLLWDSGVCQYDMPECRRYYQQARAHNVVLVDDADLALDGKPVLHMWRQAETYDFVDAEAAFKGIGVRHRRQVLFVRPRTWVIRDVLRSDKPHRYTRLFHVREKAKVEIDGAVAAARDGDGPTLIVQNLRPAAARIEIGKGLLTYHHGRGSGSSNLPAPVVEVVANAPSGAADLVTVLTATPAGGTPPPSARLDERGGALVLDRGPNQIVVTLPPLKNGAGAFAPTVSVRAR